MHETQVTLLGDGCDSYFGMSGAPVFERDVRTGERQIRGVISYALCPSRTDTCDCCPEQSRAYAFQILADDFVNILAWAARA
jgi:hypothetical protein